jgi:hypothetical protein
LVSSMLFDDLVLADGSAFARERIAALAGCAQSRPPQTKAQPHFLPFDLAFLW